MSLTDFLTTFNIDMAALKRVRQRVFVVGRFNQQAQNADPELYLFTNREVSPRFAENFKSTRALNYENFVEELHPTIAEVVEKSGRFNSVRQVIPSSAKDAKGASVIDQFNYFFQRAVANSKQAPFDSGKKGLQLLASETADRGREILKQIRRNIGSFCEFQPRTHEIISAVERLLEACAGNRALPGAYAEGAPLPGGFAESLIDFIYDENTSRSFRTVAARLDFSRGPWKPLATNPGAREDFVQVIDAFRDQLVIGNADRFATVRFGLPLQSLARDAIPQELREAFVASRGGYNGLRQILRSKVLLSMVLQWLTSALMELPSVQAERVPARKFRAASNAILNDYRNNSLAAPKRRPDRDERERFSQLLRDNFERVLMAIVTDDETQLAQKLGELDPALRNVVDEVRKKGELRNLLRRVSGSSMGPEMQKAFLDAGKTMLVDVMCPVLYRSPIVSAQELKQFFKQETRAAYLTAIFLSDSNQEGVRKIARDHLELFESKINTVTRKVDDVGQIHAALLTDYLNLLADPKLERQLLEGLTVLAEVQALLDAGESSGQQGAGAISALRVSELARVDDPLEETSTGRQVVEVAVQNRAERVLQKLLAVAPAPAAPAGAEAAAGATASASGAASVGGSASAAPASSGKVAAGERSAPAAAAAPPADDQTPSAAIAEIDERIGRILKRIVPAEKASASAEDKARWAKEAAAEVNKDEAFVGGLEQRIRAFEKTLHLIYTRYNENPDKRTFRNNVERLTLINMMLLFQKDLGFGQVTSNLYALLLDLVQETDPKEPDAKDFLRRKSLTLYFDDDDLAGDGFGELTNVLKVQANESMRAVVQFVSELRGVKYLIDAVRNDPEVEVVVVNCSADAFSSWLKSDNLVAKQGRPGRLRAGRLQLGDRSDEVCPPGLIYMSDTAFDENTDQKSWLGKLQSLSLAAGDGASAAIVLPPILLSGSAGDRWREEAEVWIAAATGGPVAVVVAGPSFRLNPAGDGFPTTLPAGYAVCAHLLAAPAQSLRNDNIQRSAGRLRSVGFGADLPESLGQFVWGEGAEDSYCFAADFYLYMILLLTATAKYSGAALSAQTLTTLYRCFYWSEDVNNLPDPVLYRSSREIDAALPGKAFRFALDQDVSRPGTALASVTVFTTGEIDKRESIFRARHVEWFGAARSSAGL